VKLLAKPIQGKANEALVDYLAEFLGVKKREIVIVSGEKDTRKIVSVPIDMKRLIQLFGNEGDAEKGVQAGHQKMKGE
jgi:uncharacterized protein